MNSDYSIPYHIISRGILTRVLVQDFSKVKLVENPPRPEAQDAGSRCRLTRTAHRLCTLYAYMPPVRLLQYTNIEAVQWS